MNTLTKNELVEHDVFEFVKGTFSGEHWSEDSIYIPENLFQQNDLEKIFNLALNSFSYFGITTIEKEDWVRVKNITKAQFPQAIEIIKEIDEWAQLCFIEYECFTICGV